MLLDQTPAASDELWENADKTKGISASPLCLVYHLEKTGPSTAQADATAAPIPEGNLCHYMCNHFSALCPSDVPTFSKKTPNTPFG